MYLIPRLIGVGIYALLLIIVYYLIPRTKRWSIPLNIYTIALALMGFFYVPMDGSDLTRIYPVLQLYAQYALDDPESWGIIMASGTPMAALYYHVLSNLGDERWLPFVNACLTYGLCFALLKSICKRRQVLKKDIALVLLFFMSRGLLMMTIANIRTMLSMAIVAYCIYKILIEHKGGVKYFSLLIIAALIHAAGMAAVMVFIVYYVLKGNKGRNRLFTTLGVLIFVVVSYVYGRNYIHLAIDKGGDYLAYSQASTGYFYIWEFVLSLIVIFVTLFILLVYYLKINRKLGLEEYKKEREEYGAFMGFMLFFTLIDLVAIWIEFNIGWRLSWLIAILDMPLLLLILVSKRYPDTYKYRLRNLIKIISFVLLFIACVRGDLCSLKFV